MAHQIVTVIERRFFCLDVEFQSACTDFRESELGFRFAVLEVWRKLCPARIP